MKLLISVDKLRCDPRVRADSLVVFGVAANGTDRPSAAAPSNKALHARLFPLQRVWQTNNEDLNHI